MDSVTDIVVVLTGIVAVIVSLITSVTAAKRSAFEDLKEYVEKLEKALDVERAAREKLQKELEAERKQRIRIENWARTLVRQLQENHITPEPFPKDELL